MRCRLLYILSLLCLLCGTWVSAQGAMYTVVEGEVLDSLTNEPLPYATIALSGTTVGTSTDLQGRFKLETSRTFKTLQVSMIGYATRTIKIQQGRTNRLHILMSPGSTELAEVVVRPKKEKYSKKNNPAVELLERIRAQYPQQDPRNDDYYTYDKLERMTLALDDFKGDIPKGSKWEFVKEHMDTSEISGKPILPISVREKVSRMLYRRQPSAAKEVVTGVRNAGIEDIADGESMRRFVEDVFREVDIFSNDITIMQNRFVSPLSNIASNYYKFYLGDTIPINGRRCAELIFVPHNAESFGFNGRIFVDINDSTLFIPKVMMQVPKAINLNYVEGIYIVQDYEQGVDGKRHKTRDDMTGEFRILPGTQGLYAQRSTMYTGFDNRPVTDGYEQFYDLEGERFTLTEATKRDDGWWSRTISEHQSQGRKGQTVEGVAGLLARLRGVPLYYWTEKVLSVLVNGYLPTGNPSRFDFGPVNTLVSANTVEGARFRIGGMTTAHLSPHIFARGYVAYGTKDRKFKYGAEVEYSFIPKEYHSREFPVNAFKLEHRYDVDQLGQHYLFTNADNIFLSLKRQPDDKMTYRRYTRLSYKLERPGGFSVEAALKYQTQEATTYLPFENGYGDIFSRYNTATAAVTLRYAPGEKFYQTRSDRLPINMDAPVLMLTHEYGPGGILGCRWTVNKTEVSFQKRFWLSAFGYTDVILKGAKIWSRVPYPELLWPNANLSYTIQPESYPLMNAMEFATDQNLQWDITYWGNGVLFNRIPLINKLKLREVVSFRGIYGSLTDKNNPALNNDLYQFPFLSHAGVLGKAPYMEAGIGIDNILTVLRVDYVWRLTYRDRPNTSRSGVRIALHFTF